MSDFNRLLISIIIKKIYISFLVHVEFFKPINAKRFFYIKLNFIATYYIVSFLLWELPYTYNVYLFDKNSH